MLSERQLQKLLKVFDARTQSVVDDYLTRMGEHLRDIGTLKAGDVHRLTQLRRLNANTEAIKRRIARAAELNIGDVEKVFRAIAASDLDFAAAMFAADHTSPVKLSAEKTISSALERILKAQLRLTAQSMEDLSRTTIQSALYRKAVDTAVQSVQAGLTDYRSAIRSAMKQAAAEGLRVEYPSGCTRRLDSAVRQNVLDGVRSLDQDIMEQLGKEYGADGVEISAHALCAEDHLPYQGLQLGAREFTQLQNSLARPIGQWNCRHFTFPILLGVTSPAHSPEQLEAYRQNSEELIEINGRAMSRYQWSQEQRRIETAIRRQKDIAIAAKASGDDLLRRECQRSINALSESYAAITDAAALIPDAGRMAVSGFHRVKTLAELKTRTEYGTIRTYASMLKDRKIVVKGKQQSALPPTGDADTIVDLIDENNKVLQRRVYDHQKRAAVDFDTTDHNRPKWHPTGAHRHLFDYSQKKPRAGWERLTDDDLLNNSDIIQRGVNYFDQK